MADIDHNNIEKKQETMESCWFAFNKNNNMFTIELNDIIYGVTPKDFNALVYSLYMFYNEVIGSKVQEAVGNFVMQDTNTNIAPVAENEAHHNASAPAIEKEDAGIAVKLWEELLKKGPENKNNKPTEG